MWCWNLTRIKDIQQVINEMQITLRELKVLEDYDGADYSEVLTELKWNHQMLKHRLTTLRCKNGE